MARRTQGEAFVPKVRGAALRAIAKLETSTRPLTDILYDLIREQPLETLRALAPYMPKESHVSVEQSGTITHEHINVPELAQRVADALAGRSVDAETGTLPH